MSAIPWNDSAVLSRLPPLASSDSSPAIEDEGTLRDVVRRLALRRGKLDRLKISLPDRRVPPYEYREVAFQALVIAYRKYVENKNATEGPPGD
jgi:hypothetical protein